MNGSGGFRPCLPSPFQPSPPQFSPWRRVRALSSASAAAVSSHLAEAGGQTKYDIGNILSRFDLLHKQGLSSAQIEQCVMLHENEVLSPEVDSCRVSQIFEHLRSEAGLKDGQLREALLFSPEVLQLDLDGLRQRTELLKECGVPVEDIPFMLRFGPGAISEDSGDPADPLSFRISAGRLSGDGEGGQVEGAGEFEDVTRQEERPRAEAGLPELKVAFSEKERGVEGEREVVMRAVNPPMGGKSTRSGLRGPPQAGLVFRQPAVELSRLLTERFGDFRTFLREAVEATPAEEGMLERLFPSLFRTLAEADKEAEKAYGRSTGSFQRTNRDNKDSPSEIENGKKQTHSQSALVSSSTSSPSHGHWTRLALSILFAKKRMRLNFVAGPDKAEPGGPMDVTTKATGGGLQGRFLEGQNAIEGNEEQEREREKPETLVSWRTFLAQPLEEKVVPRYEYARMKLHGKLQSRVEGKALGRGAGEKERKPFEGGAEIPFRWSRECPLHLPLSLFGAAQEADFVFALRQRRAQVTLSDFSAWRRAKSGYVTAVVCDLLRSVDIDAQAEEGRKANREGGLEGLQLVQKPEAGPSRSSGTPPTEGENAIALSLCSLSSEGGKGSETSESAPESGSDSQVKPKINGSATVWMSKKEREEEFRAQNLNKLAEEEGKGRVCWEVSSLPDLATAAEAPNGLYAEEIGFHFEPELLEEDLIEADECREAQAKDREKKTLPGSQTASRQHASLLVESNSKAATAESLPSQSLSPSAVSETSSRRKKKKKRMNREKSEPHSKRESHTFSVSRETGRLSPSVNGDDSLTLSGRLGTVDCVNGEGEEKNESEGVQDEDAPESSQTFLSESRRRKQRRKQKPSREKGLDDVAHADQTTAPTGCLVISADSGGLLREAKREGLKKQAGKGDQRKLNDECAAVLSSFGWSAEEIVNIEKVASPTSVFFLSPENLEHRLQKVQDTIMEGLKLRPETDTNAGLHSRKTEMRTETAKCIMRRVVEKKASVLGLQPGKLDRLSAAIQAGSNLESAQDIQNVFGKHQEYISFLKDLNPHFFGLDEFERSKNKPSI
uniref:Uncharacterized protein n=1 Tax=Chromera velia CCMP2878 TaxID=1169474 RepID=A0A0G4F9D6_9ALVE|eukprot:Cvel_15721.t1-p1 / transcript=Cvel_15721.t1 / gene=Cvel_15721 / organism=Chromera_velia_CCMP2878 / gene_product=hypothetical protein / transcript_product=hypothetical protein / location=Cvel_scaffold1175:27564-37134(-) / protein_length=1067 / sequence_SO=supercontig / SO=protein_coding / is_pseudo=false